MPRSSLSILPGTMELLALGTLARGGRLHGFEVLRRIGEASEGELLAEEGALYPALHRLEKRGWLRSEWAVSEKGRRAKYYIITSTGRKALSREVEDWGRYVTAVEKVVLGEDSA